MAMPENDEYKTSILRDVEVWDTNKEYSSGDEVLYKSLMMVSVIDDNDYIPVWPGNPFWRLKITGVKGRK